MMEKMKKSNQFFIVPTTYELFIGHKSAFVSFGHVKG